MTEPRQIPVREWSCPEHDYPQHCEECDTWHCDLCAAAGEWVTVGYRDPSPFEEMLLLIPPPRFPKPLIAQAILDNQ